MDAVVLDLTISLADKDRMKTCTVNYASEDGQERKTINHFMPKSRTFLLDSLSPNKVLY